MLTKFPFHLRRLLTAVRTEPLNHDQQGRIQCQPRRTYKHCGCIHRNRRNTAPIGGYQSLGQTKRMVFECQPLKPCQYHIPLVQVQQSQSKSRSPHPIRSDNGYVTLHRIALRVQLHLAITRLRVLLCWKQAQSFELSPNVRIHQLKIGANNHADRGTGVYLSYLAF